MTSGIEGLQAAKVLLASIDPASIRALGDDEICNFIAEVEAIARQLAPLQIGAAAEIAERSRHELGQSGLAARHGCVRPAPLIELLTQVSGAEATRRIKLGELVVGDTILSGEVMPARYPAVESALNAGSLGTDAAVTIVRALETARRGAHWENLEIAERELVEVASREPIDFVAALARAVRDRLDPDGVLPREEETRARRGLTLGRMRNGVVPLHGNLRPENAALLSAVFDEANAPGAQPRFLSDEDRRAGTNNVVGDDGVTTTTFLDPRTREQRQEDVFGGLLKAGVRNTGDDAGQLRSTASVTAVITLEELRSGKGIGWIEGLVEPVSATIVQMLACDCDYRRAVLGNDGQILAFGKTRYAFSAAQRKALAIRDGGCALCDAPPGWCDVHHVQEYNANGGTGTTDVDNGVLLCGRHHELIHRSEWQLKMINGIPHVLAPFGIDMSQTWRRVGRTRVLELGMAA